MDLSYGGCASFSELKGDGPPYSFSTPGNQGDLSRHWPGIHCRCLGSSPSASACGPEGGGGRVDIGMLLKPFQPTSPCLLGRIMFARMASTRYDFRVSGFPPQVKASDHSRPQGGLQIESISAKCRGKAAITLDWSTEISAADR